MLTNYAPQEKIMFSAVFCRNSSGFDWATVTLECQVGRRLDLDVLQCRSK